MNKTIFWDHHILFQKTLDGRNPTAVDMKNIPFSIGFPNKKTSVAWISSRICCHKSWGPQISLQTSYSVLQTVCNQLLAVKWSNQFSSNFLNVLWLDSTCWPCTASGNSHLAICTFHLWQSNETQWYTMSRHRYKADSKTETNKSWNLKSQFPKATV